MKTSYYIKYANDDYSINKKHLLDMIKSMEDYSLISIDTSGNSVNFGEIISIITSVLDVEFVYLNGLKSSMGICINIFRYPNKENKYMCFMGPTPTSMPEYADIENNIYIENIRRI